MDVCNGLESVISVLIHVESVDITENQPLDESRHKESSELWRAPSSADFWSRILWKSGLIVEIFVKRRRLYVVDLHDRVATM